jgi:phosphoglucomutase
MNLHPLAGKPAQATHLINIPKLISDYYTLLPDMRDPTQQVSFGTSGHRGSAFSVSFNDAHIAAIAQALAEYRTAQGITGPCFVGMDTHALSEAALTTTIEVLVANNVQVVLQAERDYTPTPVISRAILQHNSAGGSIADGVVITPSHNPPQDGGFKYNAAHGGPADTDATSAIQTRANALLEGHNRDVKRMPIRTAMASELAQEIDFMESYIADLANVVDMAAIKDAQIKIGVDPLGGSGMRYWQRIGEVYDLDITVVNEQIDPTFRFMTLDKDGQIRMDCSSPYAMAGLLAYAEQFDIAFGNDADFDRHGIVTPTHGLLNPNHYLAVAIDYVLGHRPDWPSSARIGKTLVSSSMIDRVVAHHNMQLAEMPVGFKWFVQGLLSQGISFAGEESAGGIFLRRDGSPWATDKDGFILCLLGAEILAKTGKNPGQYYAELVAKHGEPFYKRMDVAASLAQKQALAGMDINSITSDTIAGEAILRIETHASGNQAAIGGVKVSTQNGWFAARPSGTENVYKIYAESFVSERHLDALLNDAQELVDSVIK